MKEATELMLGDWVRINGEPMKVISIPHEHKIAAEKPGQTWGTIYDTTPIDEVEPIRITPEIMAKSGWENVLSTYYTLDVDESLWAEFYLHDGILRVYFKHQSCREEVIFQSLPGIVYVHTLQHVLSLCGMTKEVKV